MTPIKEIWVMGQSVLFVDYSDRLNPIADAVNEQQAELLGRLLQTYHKRPLYFFEPAQRSMVLQEES